MKQAKKTKAMKAAYQKALKLAGGVSRLSRLTGVPQQTLSNYSARETLVPALTAIAIEGALIDLKTEGEIKQSVKLPTAKDLRPDIFGKVKG